MWLTSSENTHRIDPSQKSSQIKKTASKSTLSFVLEDMDNNAHAAMFKEIVASRYDSSMVYTTNAAVIIIIKGCTKKTSSFEKLFLPRKM